MAKVGRHTKLTKELIENVYEGFSKGLSVQAVCALNHIGRATFYDWKKQGDQATSGLLREFSEKVDSGLAEAEKRWVESVEKEQGGSRWLLAHRLRQDWGEKIEVNHSGAVEFVVSWDDSPADDDLSFED